MSTSDNDLIIARIQGMPAKTMSTLEAMMDPTYPQRHEATDTDIDAMSDGDFYHHMLDKDHYEWARQANRKLSLGLSKDAEYSLATYFASAMCAVLDRPNAGYIRARLDAEKAEDAVQRPEPSS